MPASPAAAATGVAEIAVVVARKSFGHCNNENVCWSGSAAKTAAVFATARLLLCGFGNEISAIPAVVQVTTTPGHGKHYASNTALAVSTSG